MEARALLSKAAIDRLAARASTAHGLWATAGESGLGRAPSALAKTRMTTLLWSDRAEAEAWGHLATVPGRPKFLSLPDLFVDVLPKLAELDRLAGVDWSAELLRPEIEPADLARRLRQEAVAAFTRKAVCFGSVWILQGTEGPACLMSRAQPGKQMLPCWPNREQAETRIHGPLANMVAAEVPLDAFCNRLLLWVAETGRLVAPGFCEGDGLIECDPAGLATRLSEFSDGIAAA